MLSVLLSEVARWTEGRLQGSDIRLNSVCTDTRKLSSGNLFVALSGPHFDGHDFVAEAQRRGAAALMVARTVPSELPQCVVADTKQALGRVAKGVRARSQVALVAVTGSNGKTTVKEMTASILERCAPTLRTTGNLNNDIGVPLTLLGLGDEHRYAVVEMGANHPGEIAYLASIGQPDVGVVTNAGPSHLEGFGSVEGVAHAKGEMFQALGRGATAVINADDRYGALWREMAGDARVVDFGIEADALIRGTHVSGKDLFRLEVPDGAEEIRLSLPGRHNVLNALASAAAAWALGVDLEAIRRGLEAVRPVSGRLIQYRGFNGCALFDDTYNANPGSLRAGIDVLLEHSGSSWLVLGDMAELGADALALHGEAGRQAKRAGVRFLYAVGSRTEAAVRAFGQGARHFEAMDSLIEALQNDLPADARVLIKGSRVMAMERVVSALAAPAEHSAERGG